MPSKQSSLAAISLAMGPGTTAPHAHWACSRKAGDSEYAITARGETLFLSNLAFRIASELLVAFYTLDVATAHTQCHAVESMGYKHVGAAKPRARHRYPVVAGQAERHSKLVACHLV